MNKLVCIKTIYIAIYMFLIFPLLLFKTIKLRYSDRKRREFTIHQTTVALLVMVRCDSTNQLYYKMIGFSKMICKDSYRCNRNIGESRSLYE